MIRHHKHEEVATDGCRNCRFYQTRKRQEAAAMVVAPEERAVVAQALPVVQRQLRSHRRKMQRLSKRELLTEMSRQSHELGHLRGRGQSHPMRLLAFFKIGVD